MQRFSMSTSNVINVPQNTNNETSLGADPKCYGHISPFFYPGQRLCRSSFVLWLVRMAPSSLLNLTSLGGRRRTRATLCVTPTVLYTKVDAQRDKLATVVGPTMLTTRCDDRCAVAKKMQKNPLVWDEAAEGSAPIFEDTLISF